MVFIDIVILTLNEEAYLEECIDSVLNFSLPPDTDITIYIADGGSTDKTLEIIQTYIDSNYPIILINNRQRIQSAGMNAAINQGKGDYVLRLDAHSIFDTDYLKKCFETSIRTDADNVGGVLTTMPGSDGLGAKIVQYITSHPFGVGNSNFRIGSIEGNVDTVPFGFFKKSIFNKIGGFDERLLRAQDYELNKRIIKNGGIVWLNPEIKAKYFNQPSFSKFFKKILFLEAPYNAYMWYLAPYTFSLRHSITAFFTLGLIGGLFLSFYSNIIFIIFFLVMAIYFCLSLMSSIQISFENKDPAQIIILPLCFFIFHTFHGFGVLYGIVSAPFKDFSVKVT